MLLETYGPMGASGIKPPHMNELRVLGPTRGLVDPAVSPESYDRVPRINEFLNNDRKSVPLADTSCEHSLRDRFGADVRVAVGVGKILRLVPDDVWAHVPENRGNIARREGVVYPAYQFNIVAGHVQSFQTGGNKTRGP